MRVCLGDKLFMLSFWWNGKCKLESRAVRREIITPWTE